MEELMKALKIKNFLFNPNPETRLGLFSGEPKNDFMLLIINTILFNSNSENGFSGFKKI
jgi:hypothetical protein